MSQNCSSKTLILCVIALALLAGTANAQVTACTSPLSFTYQNGVTTSNQSCALSDGGSSDTYTSAVAYTSGTNWLTGGTVGTPTALPGSLTLGISSVAAAAMLASGSPYSATITITDSDTSTTTVVVNLTVVPPIGASGGVTVGAPVAFAFTKGTVTANQTATVSDGATNTYTVGSPAYGSGATGWLTATATSNTTNSGTLTLGITASALASTAAGPYTATVLLTDSDGSTTTVYVAVTVSSPLTGSSPSLVLTYAQTGGASQAAAQYVLAVAGSDSVADSYTITKSVGCPAWFSATAATGSASSGAPDSVTMKITSTANSLTLPVTPITTCTVALKYQGTAFSTTTFTSLNVVGPGLSSATSTISLSYIKGGGGTNSVNASILAPASISAGLPFAVNVASVPAWLTLTPSTGTATSGGLSVAFAVVTATTATMAVGNYTASVHLQSTGYADLVFPVTLGISNSGATLSMKEGASAATIASIYTWATTVPAPTVTPYSSNEPLPFTASCVVGVQNSTYTSTATSCLVNGTQATALSPLVAVAYTWGYPLTLTLDSTLFSLPVGTIITATVTVTPTGGSASGTPMTLAYQYTTEMPPPTFAASTPVLPSSVAQQTVTGTSVAVLLNGTNFVGPQSIVGGVVLPTQIYLAGSTTAVSSTQITVVSSTQILLTIPQASFPTVASGHVSTTLSIGLANQTGVPAPTAATVTSSLVVTTAPVVYAVTSTASYNNGGLGSVPGFAPYELVSIFGDNFGYGALTPNFATATVNAQDQVPTSLLVSGSGTTAKYLSVTFKDSTGHSPVTYLAPILFANQNQINAIVPSGITVGHVVSVIVTSGASTNSSDGIYTVNIVGNDPGIFTVASDGTGQGAILNVNGSTGAETVNSSTNKATASQTVAIFMTGLGAPDSVHPDVNLATPDSTPFPTDCSAVSLTASATIPGYLQVGNTAKGTTAITGWTAPTAAWTSIDGAVIQGELLKTNILPPCMVDPITVTFGSGGSTTTATTTNGGVTWAGFASSSIAGLYQINVTIPVGTTLGSAVPVTVTITPASTGYTTQAGVTIAIQ